MLLHRNFLEFETVKICRNPYLPYRGGALGIRQGGGVSHISGMGQVSLYGHEQLIVSTVDHDVPQEEVVGQLAPGHHSTKIEEDDDVRYTLMPSVLARKIKKLVLVFLNNSLRKLIYFNEKNYLFC